MLLVECLQQLCSAIIIFLFVVFVCVVALRLSGQCFFYYFSSLTCTMIPLSLALLLLVLKSSLFLVILIMSAFSFLCHFSNWAHSQLQELRPFSSRLVLLPSLKINDRQHVQGNFQRVLQKSSIEFTYDPTKVANQSGDRNLSIPLSVCRLRQANRATPVVVTGSWFKTYFFSLALRQWWTVCKTIPKAVLLQWICIKDWQNLSKKRWEIWFFYKKYSRRIFPRIGRSPRAGEKMVWSATV